MRFDLEFILEQVAKAPREFDLQARNPEHTAHIGGDHMVSRPCTAALSSGRGTCAATRRWPTSRTSCACRSSFPSSTRPGARSARPRIAPPTPATDSRHLDMMYDAQARERGVKLIGATAHYVDEALDAGPACSPRCGRLESGLRALARVVAARRAQLDLRSHPGEGPAPRLGARRPGDEPDDYVDPAALSPLTRRYLKEAFRAVAGVQKRVAGELSAWTT